MNHVVMFSGGAGSWYTAKLVANNYGTDNLVLMFADTRMEDEDLYRFLSEASANVGGELFTVSDGRNPWQVFKDVRFLGNTRIDPCSRILKRELLRRWLGYRFRPEETTVYLGIDWSEEQRFHKAKKYWEPWKIEAPMCKPPYIPKYRVLEIMESEGIRPPRLYDMGFPHNNCGGFCIKAGQAHFKLLLKKMPERYLFHEEREQEIRGYLGKDVAILRDRRGGEVKPLTLREFRCRIEAGEKAEEHDWGGCACFTPEEEPEDFYGALREA